MNRRNFMKMVGGLFPLALLKETFLKSVVIPPDSVGWPQEGRWFSDVGNFSLRSVYCRWRENCGKVEPVLKRYGEWKKNGKWSMYCVAMKENSPVVIREVPDDNLYAVCPKCDGNMERLAATCVQCRHRWCPHIQFMKYPLQCPACGHRLNLFCDGEMLHSSMVGNWLGQYAWCEWCMNLTLNAPFRMGRVNDKEWNHLAPRRYDSESRSFARVDAGWIITSARAAYVSRDTVGCFYTRCVTCGCEKGTMYIIPLDRCGNVRCA